MAVAAACAPGCVSQDSSSIESHQHALAGTQPAKPIAVSEKPLPYIGGKPVLPKWKTKEERELEKIAKSAAGRSRFHAYYAPNPYETYRSNNISKFFITVPPTNTGFRAVAEFEPSQAYIMTWMQYNDASYNAFFLGIVKGVWGKLPVLMIYEDAAHKTWIEGQLTAGGIPAADLTNATKIIWWQTSFDSTWTRDFGPLSIITTDAAQKLSFVDFKYYLERVHDDEIPADLAAAWGIDDFRPDLEYEGGNFMNTTDGLCVSSKVVLQVNMQYTQAAIEDLFKKYMGCKKMIFPTGLIGDQTGHIDMFTKFGSDTTVLVAKYAAAQDASSPGKGQNVTILDQDAALFSSTATPTGKTIAVTRIPMPNWGQDPFGWYIRTYVNSQALQGAGSKTVLVPVFSDETSNEAAAMAAYAAVFPGWTVVKVDAKPIIPDGGAVHCVLMQIAVGAKSKMEPDPAAMCGNKVSCTVPVGCGSAPTTGCCDGETLKYCQAGQLIKEDCLPAPKCGWDDNEKYYACGTSGGADPRGQPKACGPDVDLGPKLDKSAGDQLRSPEKGPTDTSSEQASTKTDGIAPGADRGAGKKDPGGCSCSITQQRGASPIALLLLGLVLGIFRALRSRGWTAGPNPAHPRGDD